VRNNFFKNILFLLLTFSILSALHTSFHSDFIQAKSTISDLTSDTESQENQESKNFELFKHSHDELKILELVTKTEATSDILKDQFNSSPLTSPPNA